MASSQPPLETIGPVNGAHVTKAMANQLMVAYIEDQRRVRASMVAVFYRQVKAIYDSGVPFFTREGLQDISRQMDEATARFTPGNCVEVTFTIRGLDGVVVQIPLVLGNALRRQADDPPNTDTIVAAFDLQLRAANLLARPESVDDFKPEHAFLPFMVQREALHLCRFTGNVVPREPNQSRERLVQSLRRKKVYWAATIQGQKLLSTLNSITTPSVGKIVAMACGNLTYPYDRRRCAYQHALILVLRSFFAERQHQAEEDIHCFAQDPAYEDVDKKALSDVGITVLRNPRAFLEVDASSIVFSCYPSAPIRQVVADMARPAIMIWKKAERFGSRQGERDFEKGDYDSGPRVEAMLRDHYTEFEFPEERQLFFSEDLAIYVRNPDSPTQVDSRRVESLPQI
ncbi:hypothetical protein CONLIGDRAFT_676994 [Coniochaeta ligniaria NRRL 30616]|uniref:SRR1-like domain-containing protein n=1 Tax=Coniochaeta ligniaria NRRL 30616 TaxID=1408157 RepID=A0A1J7JT65_9PEZI|nr:hypothetical protein CONLIGDRAFT_676994 [Coniochaeta ligniaria NRRL 30616]